MCVTLETVPENIKSFLTDKEKIPDKTILAENYLKR